MPGFTLPGAANAPDNVMVWLPESQVLFGGCAVKSSQSTTLGNTADADLAEWTKAMQRAGDRYPQAEVVVPGHGEAGGLELLQHTAQLLAQPE